MNRRLSDQRIRATCRALVASHPDRVSGRQLRAELRKQFGAVGKTARVFQIWREVVFPETAASTPQVPELPVEIAELQRRLVVAETVAAEMLARAERAEYREQAHQDRWAAEVDSLRQAVGNQTTAAMTIRGLQEQVFTLSRELIAARGQSDGGSED
jgi:hypothetical protein